MPVFALELKATLSNVTDLQPSNYIDHRWYLKIKCSGCGELSKNWQYATIQDTHSLTKGKGQCHISLKCGLCNRICTLEILDKTYSPFSIEKTEEYHPIVKFECRGLEPVDFDPRIHSSAHHFFTNSTLTFAIWACTGSLHRKVRKWGWIRHENTSVEWKCSGIESGTLFDNIDLNTKEWFDYDEKAQQPVEIKEISSRFVVSRI